MIRGHVAKIGGWVVANVGDPTFTGRQAFGRRLRRMGPAPASGMERRDAPRRRTLLRARICYGAHYVISVDCGIRDLSESGAQLRVPPSQALPARFALIHILEGLAFDASLAWRRGEFAGVKFNARHNLKSDVEGELRSLKAIWAALAPT